MFKDIQTPSAIVDLDICELNIKNMVATLQKYNINHRPHFKTHRSIYFAEKQLEAGAKGITCAKLGEAEVLVEHGINDILIAFPIIGDDKIARLLKLLNKADIITIVNSEVGAKLLSDAAIENNISIKIMIEVDGGLGRGGILPGNDTLDFAKKIRKFTGISIIGLMYYGGTIYENNNENDIIKAVKKESKDLNHTKNILNENGFDIRILSNGTTYTSRYPQFLDGITEVRAGNYIFNDCAQLSIGLVKPNECALRVISTIVSIPSPGRAIIDAGSKSLGTDTVKYREGYGYVVEYPNTTIFKLNEEHGFMKFDPAEQLFIGQKITIIPNHSCIIPNLSGELLGIRGSNIVEKIKIDARGKSQ